MINTLFTVIPIFLDYLLDFVKTKYLWGEERSEIYAYIMYLLYGIILLSEKRFFFVTYYWS